MYARTLNVLHDAGDQYVRTVANSVHFQFTAHEIFIAQNGVFNALREDDIHIAIDVVGRERDGHVLSADDIGRAQKDGIFQRFRRAEGLFLGHDRDALRAGNAVFFQKNVKPLSVLGNVHAVGGRAEDADAVGREIGTQIDGGLSAERDDDAVRLLHVDDVLDVLRRQRFKVKPVRGVKVGRNRLGVIVDDDDFIAELFQGPYAMHGGIVELDALSDADGTGPDDDDTLFLALGNERLGFVIFVIGRIEIRRLRRKFGGTGIDHFEYGLLMIRHLLPRELFNVLVEIAVMLALFIEFSRKDALLNVLDRIFLSVNQDGQFGIVQFLRAEIFGITADGAEFVLIADEVL